MPMQQAAPATQHAPAAQTCADVANSATADSAFNSFVFMRTSLESLKNGITETEAPDQVGAISLQPGHA